eukprot:4633911-Amphidinium_carterae.1
MASQGDRLNQANPNGQTATVPVGGRRLAPLPHKNNGLIKTTQQKPSQASIDSVPLPRHQSCASTNPSLSCYFEFSDLSIHICLWPTPFVLFGKLCSIKKRTHERRKDRRRR